MPHIANEPTPLRFPFLHLHQTVGTSRAHNPILPPWEGAMSEILAELDTTIVSPEGDE